MNISNTAGKRHRALTLQGGIFYAASLFVELYVVRHTHFATPIKFGFTLLPAIGVILMIFSLGRYLIEEKDEYIRARTARQMLWGTGLSLSALTLWGFPEDAGLLPHLPNYFAAIFWFAGFGIAGLSQRLFDR